MTTATMLSNDELTILKLAVRGRSVGFITEALSKTREQVGQVLTRHGGTVERWQWAIDEHERDTTPRLPTRTPAPPELPRPAAQTNLTAVPTPPTGGKLEQLLARSAKVDTAPIRKARNALLASVDRLEQSLTNVEAAHRERQTREAEKAAAKAKVASLERQLREARAALRGKPTREKSSLAPTPSAGRATEYDVREVRAWARANGIDVPERGRYLAADVVDAYNAAREAEAATA